jgi:hypothetical protein
MDRKDLMKLLQMKYLSRMIFPMNLHGSRAYTIENTKQVRKD